MSKLLSHPIASTIVTFFCVGLSVSFGAERAAPFESLIAPEGFVVTQYADDDLAHDIYSMTIDSQGRVVVAGAGYVRILIDVDGDGAADEFRQFADEPKNGAMGMFFHGPDLICTGDAGLLRYRDQDGNDRADGEPDLFLKMKTGGEHDSHAIRRGPDGWWYVIAGNGAEITSSYATLPTSPVKEPHAGTLMRLKPDLTGGELLAEGLRNAYDFDFNGLGDVFTFDSDGERDISLPWYRPTRVFHLLPAADCGWITRSWKRSAADLDMPPVLGAFGRGSPTGVACYRHPAFPESYHGAIFALDWTFGRVMALPMEPDGSVWKSEPIEFLKARGQFGFAPTDVAVGPDGSLYVAVGGRGTRGSVFKVTWQGTTDSSWTESVPESEEEQVAWCLRAPQPLDSWSRARWMPVSEKLGTGKFRFAALDSGLPEESRIRAIEILVEQFGGLELSTAKTLKSDLSANVRARTVWALGRHLDTVEELQLISEFADDASPVVSRFALEAMLTAPPELDRVETLPVIARQLNSKDRFVRQSAARLVQRLWPDHVSTLRELMQEMPASAAVARELGIAWNRKQPSRGGVEIGIAILEGEFPTELKRDATRLVALSLGDVGPFPDRAPVYDGYAPQFDLNTIERTLDSYRIRLADVYPTGDKPVDLELLRILSILEPYNPDLLDKILTGIDSKSHPTEDIHRLIVASRIPVEKNYQQTEKIAQTLVAIDHKIEARQLNQDSNWDDRMTELFQGLMKQDPVLADVIVLQDGFGLPGHVMFLSDIRSAESLPKAIAGFVRQIQNHENYRWSNDVVFVLGESNNPEHQQLIRDQYENYSVRSAVLSVLSGNPNPEDRAWYVEGLTAPLTEGVRASVAALEKLGPSNDPGELFELLSAARRLSSNSEEYQLREKVVGMLRSATGKEFGFVYGKEGHKPQPIPLAQWTQQLETSFPDEARQRLGSLADELSSLRAMLETTGIEGDVARGSTAFVKRACARCHGGRRAVGPDLAGVTSRFSRQDLLTSIANPNQDVSTRYQTTLISTTQGKVYSGIIVYQSVDGLILRDGEGKTYRIEASEIETERKLPNSLMPQGLLKEITAQELADLFAYLASLKK